MYWIGEVRKAEILRADLIAGITVALVLVPQSMAYAQLAGLPPYYGLYASFLPGIIAALFGSSRQLATGPVAVVSLMTASALEPIAGANPELYIAYAIMPALMAGIFQVALCLLRLGVPVNFLSHPVVVGFTSAAAIIIATSQLGKLFGVPVEKAEHAYETVFSTLVATTHGTHPETLLMAMLALATMVILRRYLPGGAECAGRGEYQHRAVMAAADRGNGRCGGRHNSCRAAAGRFPGQAQLPSVSVVIAVIGFMEAIAIAKAMATRTCQRLDANQELVDQGLGNMVSSPSGGYAVAGSFSRPAVNISAGAKTGFSAVVTVAWSALH